MPVRPSAPFLSSLAFKISASIFIIEVVVLSFLGIYFVDRFSREIDARVFAKIRIPGHLMAQRALNYEAVRDKSALQDLVGREIRNAYVIRRDGMIFYASERLHEDVHVGEILGESFARSLDHTDSVHIEQFREMDEQLVAITTPLTSEGKTIGFLHLKVDVSDTRREKSALAWLFALTTLICVLLTTAAEVLIIHTLTVPRIGRIIGGLKKVSQGDLDVQVPEDNSRDELVLLQKNVNTMIRQVRQRTQESRKTHALLEASEQKYRQLAEFLPQTIFECDLNGRVTYTNKNGYDLFDYSEAELSHAPSIFDLLAPQDKTKAQRRFQKLLSHGSIQPTEYMARRRDGTPFPVLIYSAVISTDGQPTGIRGLLIDLSAQRKNEAEAAALKERLQQIEKMEAIGQLAGGVAHDFNNQLAALMGSVGLLRMDIHDSPPQMEVIEMMEKSITHASRLTNQLLAFARRGKQVARPINVHTVIEEVIGILSRSIDKKIELRREFTPHTCIILGDDSLLENAILNLGINARDAIDGAGTITFRTTCRTLDREFCKASAFSLQPGEYLCIEIVDTGRGIPPRDRDRIFEPFYTTKEKGRGTGLGLAAVYGTITRHEGAISLKASSAKGTTFELLLPLYATGAHDQKPAAASKKPSGDLCSGTIMLIDDEDIVRRTTSMLLTRRGFAVTPFSNGEEACEAFSSGRCRPDIILLDLVMPRMSGTEVFDTLTGLDPQVKIVLISGFSFNHKVQELLNRGARVFLHKPFEEAALLSTLQKTLGDQGPPDKT